MRHWGWVAWPVGNSFMVVISMPGRLRAAGLRVLLLAFLAAGFAGVLRAAGFLAAAVFLAVPDAAARLAPPCMVCMPLAANWLAMPVAVFRASLARPVAMFLVVSMAVCLAASFMALAAICWN